MNISPTKNGAKSATNPFKYGFKVHSISQVNQSSKQQSNKKSNKKSPTKSRKNQQQQSSPFSTTSSIETPIELDTSSVSILLDSDHLDASSALSLHDLQCGTATIALQGFLSHPNLRRVFGIEQNKNLFHWATKNLMALIKNGYETHRYLLVEQIPSTKMTIAQKCSQSQLEHKVFKVGEIVYCFIPLKQHNIKKRDNYQGIIKTVHRDGIHYDVEMSATKHIAKNVHKESIFKPGTERTFEICRGNLFERSDSFRSDIILLPYSINNDSFKSLLLTGCKRSPISSRILSFSHLESWDGFPISSLRRVDANVYDSDRYDSNISPHHRLFMYSHTLSPSLASSPKDIMQKCTIGAPVTVRDIELQQWFSAKVVDINEKNKILTVNKDGFIDKTGIEEIKIDEQRVHLISRKFRIGDLITTYCPKMIENKQQNDKKYTLYRGQIVVLNANGTYGVQFEDGETHPSLEEIYIFATRKHRLNEGQLCIASRYDKISEINTDGDLVNVKKLRLKPNKIERNECIIRHCNPDGSYRIEFINITSRLLHDSFCELWLKAIDEEKDNLSLNYIEPKLPLCLEIDYDKVLLWKPNIVSHWLHKCGVSLRSCHVLQSHHVNGVFLFDLDVDLLTNDMEMDQYDAVQVMRYMRALRSKLQYNTDEEDEEIATISLEIQEYDRDIKQLQRLQQNAKDKFEKLIKGNHDEYAKYREWELKIQCLQLNQNKKFTKKDIAAQLKRKQTWVNKTCKLKPNQIKKPTGNVIKQFDAFQSQIFKTQKQIKEKQTQMLVARQKLQQFIDD